MSKRTPGPWRVDSTYAEDYGVCIVAGAGDRWICGEIDNDPDKIPIEFGCHHGLTPQQVFALQTENAANASLIAAAPDLLAALEQAVEYARMACVAEGMPQGGYASRLTISEGLREFVFDVNAARSVIAKARGLPEAVRE